MLTSTVLRERKTLMFTLQTRVITKYGWIQSFILTNKYKFHDHSLNVSKWFFRWFTSMKCWYFWRFKSGFLVHANVRVDSLCFWNSSSNILFLLVRPRVSSPVHPGTRSYTLVRVIQLSCTLTEHVYGFTYLNLPHVDWCLKMIIFLEYLYVHWQKSRNVHDLF